MLTYRPFGEALRRRRGRFAAQHHRCTVLGHGARGAVAADAVNYEYMRPPVIGQ